MPLTVQANELHANLAGEIYRRWAFPGPGYGCYSSFDVRTDLVSIDPLSNDHAILGKVLSDTDSLEAARAFFDDVGVRPAGYRSPEGILVGWYWDGDGVLVFIDGQVALVNDDCKKDYCWKHVPLVEGLARPQAWRERTAEEIEALQKHPTYGKANSVIMALELLGRLDRDISQTAELLVPKVVLAATTDPALVGPKPEIDGLRAALDVLIQRHARPREIADLRRAQELLRAQALLGPSS